MNRPALTTPVTHIKDPKKLTGERVQQSRSPVSFYGTVLTTVSISPDKVSMDEDFPAIGADIETRSCGTVHTDTL